MNFAPRAFQETRKRTTSDVEKALELTQNLRDVSSQILKSHPSVLPMLRMATCPPIARDRLIGLAGVSPNLVKNMEISNRIPPLMKPEELSTQLDLIGKIIEQMADPDIFVWKGRNDQGTPDEIHRASIIVADRLCGAVADPIIRNAQEQRQFAVIKEWLEARGYRELHPKETKDWLQMPNGTFSFRFNIPVSLENGRQVNIPVDVVIKRRNANNGDLPALFEAKSAGDFTNINKRRKEEAIKIQQLRRTYGSKVTFDLFLCGYFDSGYLGYEAAEGIDWVWEHRIEDFSAFGF